MDKVVVVTAGLVAIGLIVWWFFGKRTQETVVATRQGDRQTIEVVVDGGYKPGIIELKKGVPVDIVFTRKDRSACFEEVILPDFGVRTHLPVDEPYTVAFTPNQAGEYKYSCGMNMFFGKVIVK
ncbi:MAG: cupredoxin domain-containing protein [Candidatus Saccharibacteria bacterium]